MDTREQICTVWDTYRPQTRTPLVFMTQNWGSFPQPFDALDRGIVFLIPFPRFLVEGGGGHGAGVVAALARFRLAQNYDGGVALLAGLTVAFVPPSFLFLHVVCWHAC